MIGGGQEKALRELLFVLQPVPIYFLLWGVGEKEMATHSSILAWRIPWAEEPGGLQSMGLHRVGYDWVTNMGDWWRGSSFHLLRFVCEHVLSLLIFLSLSNADMGSYICSPLLPAMRNTPTLPLLSVLPTLLGCVSSFRWYAFEPVWLSQVTYSHPYLPLFQVVLTLATASQKCPLILLLSLILTSVRLELMLSFIAITLTITL